MDVADYILMVVAALGLAGVGRLITRDGLARPLLLGIAVQSVVAALLAWTAPVLIVPLFRISIAVGWAVLVHQGYRRRTSEDGWVADIFKDVTPALAAMAAFCAVAVFVAMGPYHHAGYLFTSHDVTYFAPLVEVFQADYLGGLRAPTYYPALMSSHQLAPTMALAALSALLPEVTMVHAVEARYLLVSAFYARAAFLLWRHTKVNPVIFVLGLSCVVFLLISEVGGLVHTSTYIYQLIVIEFFLLVLSGRNQHAVLLILALSMILMRTSIFYSAAALAGYLFLADSKLRTSPWCVAVAVLVVANLIAMSIVPKPYGNFTEIDIGFTIANPFSQRPSLDYRNFLVMDRITNLFPGLYLSTIGVGIAFVLAISKYYLLGFAAFDRLRRNAILGGDRIMARAMEIYLLASLAGWIFVRNGQHGGTYQLYGPMMVGLITGMAVLLLALGRDGKKWKAALAGITALAIVIGVTTRGADYFAWAGFGAQKEDAAPTSALTYEQAMMPPGSKEQASLRGVRAMILGQRLMASDVTLEQSAFRNFIQKGTENAP